MGAKTLSSRAIIGAFYEALAVNSGMGWVPMVSMEFESDQPSEDYNWLGMSPAMREWIGSRNAKGFRENGINIKNKKFEATISVLVDEIRRDKTGQVMLRIGELADRTAAHWASLLSTLIINGESSLCYDGQFFFDTDHVEGDSGTQTNDLAAGDYAELNVAVPANPTPSELADVIMKMVQHFYRFKDDQGEPINEFAKNFVIMTPVNMWGAALTAVTSKLLNTGSGAKDNPIEGLRGKGINIDVEANPRLTATDKLFAFRTDGRAKPFIRQSELDVQMQAIAEGSEEEFKNDHHLYGVKANRNVGYGMWQHGILATLS